jgi:glycine/D-amino acid oxidase-like deaminating enzyme
MLEVGVNADRSSSVMGYSSDSMPYVGEVPDKPNQMMLAGFSGHGMPLILLSAKAIVEMLRGRPFGQTGVPSLFHVTKERLESTRNEILGR